MKPDDKIIALCVGHSRWISGRRDGGSISVSGEDEWHYNDTLARELAQRLHDRPGIASVIINEYQGSGYTTAMRNLASQLRTLGNVGLAVELHFNSATGKARGHEWLHWCSSKNGLRAATEMHLAVSRAFPQSELPARGVQSISASDRGAEFLRLTPMPAIICEPFFGDNAADWKLATTRFGELADAMASGLANAFRAIP